MGTAIAVSLNPDDAGTLYAPDLIDGVTAATTNGAVQYLYTLWERRNKIFSDVLSEQLNKKRDKAERGEFKLTNEHIEYIHTQFMPLVLEGARKAQEASTEAKIRRLAAILANGLEETAPTDLLQEMFRIAMELTDVDVEFLRQMNRNDRFRPKGPGLAPIEEANDEWNDIRPRIEGVDRSHGQSIAAKLQSFGLIEAVERRQMKLGPEETPYRLLRKGADFIRFIREF